MIEAKPIQDASSGVNLSSVSRFEDSEGSSQAPVGRLADSGVAGRRVVAQRPKLLLIDDDEEIRTQLRWALSSEFEVVQAGDRASAIEAMRMHRPAVVLLDLGLPPQTNRPDEGLATLSEVLDIDPLTKVVIASGQNEREIAMSAVGAGAYHFLCKPVDSAEVLVTMRRCLHVASLEREYRELQRKLMADGVDGMLGSSPEMQRVCTSIRKVATTEAPVLILGESGTGKEMAARAIHDQSARKSGPFVAINCSAIPGTLLESELFGHEKGAFTGAQVQRKGRIEQANGGTLFLDEIGDVPPAVQVKLLRFLQEKTIERIGGRGLIAADARVVAATHKDLDKGRKEGSFREDFYYRLSVVQIALPPLRARGDDLTLLAQAFLRRYALENRRGQLAFAPETLRALQRYPWPGNIRELQNRIRRAVIMGEGQRVSARDLELPEGVDAAVPTLRAAREDMEREMIRRSLERHEGRIALAATELGISRPSLYDLMTKLGLNGEEAKA